MKQPSIKINMILNAVRSVLGMLFPLITFPYVSRVLGAEGLGKYNFANSVISYFVLIAGLGIYSYAVREGSRFRSQHNEFSKFANEMYSINILSTALAYILLLLTVICVPKFRDYQVLIAILSFQLLFKAISVEWIYTIYEDFLYITIRSIFIQVLSLLTMFVFVRSRNDLYIYTAIVTLSTGGSSLFNILYAKKYTRLRPTIRLNLSRHLKPVLLIFATSIAVTIYVSSDMTLLGFFCDDRTVGIYSVSVKVYSIVKQVIVAVLSVVIPRLAFYLGQNEGEQFRKTVEDLFRTLTSLLLPAVVGIFLLAEPIVYIVAGEEFREATASLQWLSVALIFCLYSWSWGQCILITFKEEKRLFLSTIISAVVNVLLNLILIPYFKESAAAFTTVVAEAISFSINLWFGRKYVKLKNIYPVYGKVFAGCLGIVLVNAALRFAGFTSVALFTVTSILASVIVYLFIEIFLKNEALSDLIQQIKHKRK